MQVILYLYTIERDNKLKLKIMKTLKNEINKINEIKTNITTLENSLKKYMSMDLSNNETRNEMRIVLNKISKLESTLSTFVNGIEL